MRLLYSRLTFDPRPANQRPGYRAMELQMTSFMESQEGQQLYVTAREEAAMLRQIREGGGGQSVSG
jgi:hypothetical protein